MPTRACALNGLTTVTSGLALGLSCIGYEMAMTLDPLSRNMSTSPVIYLGAPSTAKIPSMLRGKLDVRYAFQELHPRFSRSTRLNYLHSSVPCYPMVMPLLPQIYYARWNSRKSWGRRHNKDSMQNLGRGIFFYVAQGSSRLASRIQNSQVPEIRAHVIFPRALIAIEAHAP